METSDSGKSARPVSPVAQVILAFLQPLLAPMTAIIGGLWVVYTYVDGQQESRRKELETRVLEAQRPFLEKQLSLYFETAQVVGRLIALTPDDKAWVDTEQRFWTLYWSELSMVEDAKVESAMAQFSKQLREYTGSRKMKKQHNQPIDDAAMKFDMNQASIDLAHAIRSSIETRWAAGK